MDYYIEGEREVLSDLRSSRNGLNSSDAAQRLSEFGENIIVVEKKSSFLSLFFKQFNSYLVWLLVVLAGFAFFTGYYFNKPEQIIDGIIITIILFVNTILGAYQDYKAEKAAELLKDMLKNFAYVKRDGSVKKIDSSSLVQGDIIMLQEGDKVPADARILECKDFFVDESLLTGESVPVNKISDVVSRPVPLADRKDMVYMNTFVTRGSALCVVTKTGKRTEVGKIARSFNSEKATPFIDEIDSASKKITYVALALIIAVSIIFFLNGYDWISVLMIGSALIIGAVPEGLPAIVTFTLALGSRKLADKKILVKSKTLLETLGSVDVICTDKTGTLTENKMAIKKLFFDGSVVSDSRNVSSSSLKAFRNCVLLCNEAKLTDNGFKGDAEDIAFIDFFQGTDISDLKKSYPIVSLEPFSSETRRSRSFNKVGKKLIRYTKGAHEVVLNDCSHILKNGKVIRLTSKEKERIESVVRDFSDDALRNIALSYCDVTSLKKDVKHKDIFIGFVGIYDKPKEGISATISNIYNSNIDIKMITGDNIYTATAIAKECGFRDIKALDWEHIKNLSDEELRKVVLDANVFARMSPENKVRIVSALQAGGRRVAITGDGVNDVPALKKADVGISMGEKGSDIAKEAGDVIILNDDLSSIVEGVKEGRTIFSNIRKVINYLLTANLSEVLVVFLGSLLGVMPFVAIQLLWVNFVTDVAPAMALGIDPSHEGILKKKPTGKDETLINKRITLLTIFIGLKKVAIIFGLFLLVYKLSNDLLLAQTMSFTWLVLSHFVRIAAIRFDEKVPLFVNKYLNWAIIIPVVVQVGIVYSPIADFFHAVPLTLREWALIVFAVLVAVGLAKVITSLIAKFVPETDSDY